MTTTLKMLATAALKSERTTIIAAGIDASGYAAQFNALREP